MLSREFETKHAFGGASAEAWRALVDADLKGAPFEKRLVTHTYEGLYVRPLYTRADWDGAGDPSGVSGSMPMTRGARVLGGSQHGWDIRQERVESDPATLNAALLDDLRGGVGSVVLRLDAAARSGLDGDDARGAGLCARDGAAVYSLGDLEMCLAGVHPEMIWIGLEAGSAFAQGAALLSALWSARGVKPGEARGGFGADPLAVLARDGGLPYALSDGLSRLADLAKWTAKTHPRATAVRVGTAAYHHAGATATQDLAFSMATGLEYLRAMTAGGMSVEEAAGQVQFSFAVGCNFFLAIAKLRAARRLWARVVEACGGGEDARRMTMHVRPSKRVMTSRDPWVNILRNSACVFAAGVAGADAVGALPMDCALGEPSELARRIARNTHHILMDECHLHRVNDPAGGSWYLERLTDELCERAWVILQAIEARGGMAASLLDGWVGAQIDTALEPRMRNIATRREGVLGVSEFPNLGESEVRPAEVDTAKVRAGAVDRVRRARNRAQGSSAGENGAARSGMDELVRAARGGATVGQLTALLTGARAGAGHAAPAVLERAIHVHPYAEAFERLREASDEYVAACGHRPRVFLASVGAPADHLARTNYSRNLMEAGGFEVTGGAGYADAGGAVEAWREAGTEAAAIAVICGKDEQYPTLVPELARGLHAAGVRTVILAGNPGANEGAYREAGVDRFVFVKCDVVGVLRGLLVEEGVLS